MQKVKAFGDWLTKWFTAIVIVWAVFNYFVPQASLWGKSYTRLFPGYRAVRHGAYLDPWRF